MTPDLQAILHLARQGAALAREQLGQVERQLKRGEEAVTEADRAVQRLIVAGLQTLFPDDGIIGEENDDGSAITNRAPTNGQRVWVIDPIDGTNNYVAGFGAFAICIGLLDHGVPTLGVVCDVTREETYAGQAGQGAWLVQHRPGQEPTWRQVTALTTAPGAQSLLMLTSNLIVAGQLPRWAFRLLTVTPWKLRMIGSAALECVQVGAGTAHGAITLNGKLWDVAAAAAVTLAAGGRVTDFDGRDVFPIDLTGYSGGKVPFLAAAPSALPALLAELAHREPVVPGPATSTPVA
jgi:myo-inositol-1(or 4)-monophosphatase